MKQSRTGKPLCSRCRKLATHKGNYHRSDGEPASLFYCAEHAESVNDAIILAYALPVEQAVTRMRCSGVLITLDGVLYELDRPLPRSVVQNMLARMYPETFSYVVSEEFQASMDSLLSDGNMAYTSYHVGRAVTALQAENEPITVQSVMEWLESEGVEFFEREIQHALLLLQCAKCQKIVDPDTFKRYHGCCSEACDRDEGITIIIALPADNQ